MKSSSLKSCNLIDLFVVLMLVLIPVSAFYTVVHPPAPFSGQILKEGVLRYYRVEVVAPDEEGWFAPDLSKGVSYQNLYGRTIWSILEYSHKTEGGRKVILVVGKVLVEENKEWGLRFDRSILSVGEPIYFWSDKKKWLYGKLQKIEPLSEIVPF